MFTTKFFFILVILLLNAPNIAKSYPLRKNERNVPIIPTTDQLKFMQQFGYLEGPSEYAAQYSQKTIYEAVMNIQRFGGLEQTGIIDEQTIQLMHKRRCGVKDIDERRTKRFALAYSGWKSREITYFISNWTALLGEEVVTEEVQKALDIWARYGNLTFVKRNDSEANIVIKFVSGKHEDPFPLDGPGNILAHAFCPYVLYGGELHFDNDESWSTLDIYNQETTNFFSVAMHELGHNLGLAHSDIESAIMFPYYKMYRSTELDQDDVMALTELYGGSNLGIVKNSSRFKSKTSKKKESIQTEGTSHESHTEDVTEPSTPSPPPNICDGKYDAVAVLRHELFVFIENNVWRFKEKGYIEEGYPVKIHNLFPNLPKSIQKIQAAYEKLDGSIVFFSGANYWIYRDYGADGPFPISSYNLPYDLEAIDATFTWPTNGKTYFFKGDRFWRYNETTQMLDFGYPKSMLRWKGIPNDIDAAITWTDGLTYFFKGIFYWRFDDVLIKADKHYPLPAPQSWFGCPENMEIFQQLPKEIYTRGYMMH